MPRALFEKTGNAVYISHLDLMRVFQRAFKRAGLNLTHTQGFSPRPSVSIALPLSVGVQSHCELLDFDLEGEQLSCEEIKDRLNAALIEGVKVRSVYADEQKIKNIALLDCSITLTYDSGIPEGGEEVLRTFFSRQSVTVEKRGKNGVTQQDIIPLLRRLEIVREDDQHLRIDARICCQNPALNPSQLTAAIECHIPGMTPDFAAYCRKEIYDCNENIFR